MKQWLNKYAHQLMKAIAFVPFVLFCDKLYNQTPVVPDEVKNTTFRPGEKLTYRISYSGWLNVGECVFEVKPEMKELRGKKVYHMYGTGRSFSWYDWFFKVRDTYQTFIDSQSYLPLKFVRDVYEGSHAYSETIDFYHETNKAVSKKKTYAITPDVHDVLSAIYYFRCFDFSRYETNQVLPVKVAIDDEVFNLKIQYNGRGTITTRAGKYKCLIFKVVLIPGTIFKSGAVMDLWASDDENKVPLKVKADILVGSIIAELTEYSGLRYPFISKIK